MHIYYIFRPVLEVDLTKDEEQTEDQIFQTVARESMHEVQSSPESPLYSPFTPPE